MLRFKLKPTPPNPNTPAGAQVFEIEGTPQGDRYYLDHLGLLDAFLSARRARRQTVLQLKFAASAVRARIIARRSLAKGFADAHNDNNRRDRTRFAK